MLKFSKINKKHIITIAIISVIVLSFASYQIFNVINNKNQSAYADKTIEIDLNKDGQKEKVELKDGEINISSKDGESLSLIPKNHEVNRDVLLIKDKIIVKDKTKNTSSLLTYSIYEMDGDKLNKIASKEDIYKGILSVEDNNMVVKEPVYEKTDCNAIPTYTLTTKLQLQNNTLVTLSSYKTSYSQEINYDTNQYYKNPSYAEIEKILENVAYEKGIPSEIFKSIAWQESKGADSDNGGAANWRQFKNGGPLIGYDGIGIGIMQVSDYDPNNTTYVDRLKYDIEFNIREGAEILLKKWALQNSSPTYKIPKIGDATPHYLEHWYYAIWAYNGYALKNNPADHHETAYQTLVIGHANNVFKKNMLDLYVYNPNLFTSGQLPRNDISEIDGKNLGDFKKKEQNCNYIVTTTLNIRDINNSVTGSYNKNDIVTVKGDHIFKDAYVRYYVEGAGKNGYVVGNWLKPIGDVNSDREIDLYDFTMESKNISTAIDDTNRINMERYDINMDGIVDIQDIATSATNYNNKIYRNGIGN